MNFISYNTSLFNTSHVFNNSNTQNAPVIAVLQDLSNRANLLIENPKFKENGQLEFGGSPAIFDTLEDESPLSLFSDDFYLSFKINVGSLNGTQPIMSLKDGANWKVYLDGSSLIMQGDSTSSLTPTILKVEDAIPYAEIPYTVAIIKSYTTKVLVNGDLKGSFDGVPSFLSSNPLLNGESFLGYDLIDDLPTYLNGTLDSIVLVRVDSIISETPAQIASTLSTLKLFTCFGKSNVNPSVCSGHGNCFGADICHCSGNYTGEECETPLCYGISAEDEQNVCSGRGACTEPNKCECKPSFIGSYCQIDTSKTTCTSTDGSCTTDDPGSYFASTNSTPTLSCAPFCQTISTLSTTTTVTSVTLRDGDRVVFALADQPNGYPKTILSDKVVIDRDNLFQMVIKNATISNKGASFNGENSFLTTYLNSPFDIKNDFSFTFVLSFDNTTTTPQPIATSNFYLEKTSQNSIKYIGYLNAEKSVTESVESDVHVIPSDNSVVAVTLVKSKKNGISIYVNGLPVVRLPTTKSLSTVTETYFGFSKSNSSSTSLRGSFKFVGLVAGAFDDKQAIQDFADYTTCFGISTLSSDVCSGHGTCVYTDNCECKKGYVSYDCSLVATSQEYDFSNLTSQVGKTFIRGNLVQESDNQNTKIFNEILECEDCSIVNGLTSSNEGLYFNGISSKIDIPHDSSLVYFHNDFTTTLWLKKTKKNGNSTQVVIYMGSPSYWQLVALEETNGFKLMILDQYTTRTVTSLLDYELYYFIAITKDSAYGLSVYVNNQFTNYYQDTEGYYTWRRTIDSVLIMSAIGYNPSTRASYFSGAITKIRFDSAVLSALAINSTISIENSIQSIESRYNKEGPMCNSISTPALQCSKLSGVDNSGGDCLEYDICKCSSRYYGKFCQDYTCFDVMNNQSDVCNGHGLCLHADRCDCLETWSGLTCAYPTCYNHNDTSACNKIKGWGVCTDYNKCTCTEGYTGQECEIPICFGIPNSAERKPSICGSHGDCIARDSCTCNVNWVGPECTIPECKGKNATDPDVCSRHGFCSVAELCVCNSRYYGYDCEFLSSSVFKAIPFNASIVTSNGKYLFGDGKDSEIVVLSNDNNLDGNSLSFTTNSKLSFTVRQEALIYRPVVFQPFDRLLSNNFTVLIKFKFYGSLFKPQALLNFASGADWRLIYFNNSLLVQSNIIDGMSNQISVPISLSSNTPYTLAVSKDSQKGFSLFVDGTRYASNATLVEDWNVMNISRNTMNTIGYIPSMSEYDYYKLDGAIETLELSLGETLPDIFLVICNGKRGNDTSVCSGVGVCEFDSTCTCDNVHDGVDCEYHKCFGISSSNSSACNSHGSCVSVNACNCTLEYSGSECQYPICFNVPSDKNFVCSSRGTCIDPDVCICDDGYYGENCEIPMCDGLLANNSNVCSGNGQCIAHDTCICSSNFTGYICSIPICYGLNASDHHVCSSQGVCIAPDQCLCNNNTDGIDCSIITCAGLRASNPQVCGRIGKCIAPDVCEYYHCSEVESTQPEVCSSRGKCIGNNLCECDENYFGVNCQNWTCVVNNISDCSSRGSCDYANHCVCYEGHTGDACEISNCFDILSNDSSVCSENGKCIDRNTCSCDPTYTGENCSIPICFGLSAVTYGVCAGHGSCGSPDNCSCELGFFGLDCSLTTCFGIVSNESIACGRIGKCIAPDVCEDYYCFGVESNETQACSSRGKCVGNNSCECDENYFGVNCQNWTCVVNNISDCSSRGSCDYANHCICRDGYTGDACEISNCFNVLSNDSSVCSSHGSCLDIDKCVCQSTYVGIDCSVPICFNLNASDSNVCSGRGICSSPDTCKCSEGFTGSNCEFIICNGIPNNETNVCGRIGKCIAPDVCENYTCYGVVSNDTSVCSTHGLCVGNNNCECTDEYSGYNCQLWPCNVNNITNCSYHGYCDYANHCTCLEGYDGLACELSICFSVLSNDSSVCSSHGSCVDKNTCSCASSYVGIDCSIPLCFGLNASDSNVCSGRGICSSPDTCKCSEGFTGSNCEFIICNGIPNNETNVCGRIGKCIAPDVCENYTCYGVVSNDTSVCSTHGLCVGNNICECTDEYSGYNCQIWPCNVNNITNCSSRGYCDYANHCTCSEGHVGDACEISNCFNVLSNDSSVCSSHGSCVDKNACSCVPSYVGIDCSVPICFNLNASDSNVCSGRGICSSPDTCKCSEGFTGSNCEFTLCYGIPNNETIVCNGHGNCTHPDNCECNGYTGSNCSTPVCYGLPATDSNVCAKKGTCSDFDTCNWFICYGFSVNDSSVCSGSGVCVSNNTCACSEGYTGEECQYAICYGKYGKDACNNGHCSAPNNCTCDYRFEGIECNITSYFDCSNTNNCSAHGTCIAQDVCVCSDAYRGENCSIPVCFNKTLGDACSSHGECILPGVCKCNQGFTGKNCEYLDSSKSCSNITTTTVSVSSKSIDVMVMDVTCSNLVIVSSQKLSDLELPSANILSTTQTIFDGTYYLTVINYEEFSILMYTQMDVSGSTYNWKYLSNLTLADQIDKIFIMNSKLYGITIGTNNMTVTNIEFYGSLSSRSVSKGIVKTSLYDNKQLSNHTFSRETVKDLNLVVGNITSIVFTATNKYTFKPALVDYNVQDRTMSVFEFPDKDVQSTTTSRAVLSAINEVGTKILVATITDQGTKLFIATITQKDSITQPEMSFEQIAYYPSEVAQFSEQTDKISIVKLNDQIYLINNVKKIFVKVDVVKKTVSDISFTERSIDYLPESQFVYKPKLLKISKDILPIYTGSSYGLTFDSIIPKGATISTKLNSKVSYSLNSPTESLLCKNFQVCVTTSDLYDETTISNKKPITFFLGLGGLDTTTSIDIVLYDNSIKKIVKLSDTKLGIYGVYFKNYQVKVKYEYLVNEILVSKVVDATFVSEDYVTVDMVLEDLSTIGFISVQVSSDNGEVYSPKSLSTYVMFTPSESTTSGTTDNSTSTTTTITVIQEEEKSISGVLTFLTSALSGNDSDTSEEEAVDLKTGVSSTVVKPVFIPVISKKTGEITIKVSVGFVSNSTKSKCSTNANQVVKSVIPTSRKFTLLEKRVSIEFAVAKPDADEATLMEMLINDQTTSGYFSSSISIKNGAKYFNSVMNLGSSFETKNLSTPCEFKEGTNMKLDMKVTHSFSQLDYSEWSSQNYKDWKATLSYTIKDSNGDALCNPNSFVLPLTYPQFIEKFSNNYTLRLESSVTCADILNKPTINIETDLYNIMAACKVQKCVAHATLIPNMDESADMTAILAGALSGFVIVLMMVLLVAGSICGVWYYRRKKMKSSKYSVYDYAHNRDDLQDAMNDLFDKMNSSDDQISSSTATTTNVIPDFDDDEDPSVLVNSYTAWM